MQEPASLRIVFAGTPEFAAAYLQSLIDSPHRVVAAYTQPDRPAGRGKRLTASPVKLLAQSQGLPVYQPESLKDAESQSSLAALEPDLLVVVAYGLILPQAVLDLPRYGCINVHASLLPRWRGAAPVQRAIEAGDAETGVTIMQMDAGLDTGPMLAKARCIIQPEDTSGALLERLSTIGKQPLLQTLNDIALGQARAEAQNEEEACYAPKIDKGEAAIDWSQPAALIERKLRAFNPFPVAWSELEGQRIKIYRAALDRDTGDYPPGTIANADEQGVQVQCGSGSLRILDMQLPGKRPMNTQDLLRGHRQLFAAGKRFHV